MESATCRTVTALGFRPNTKLVVLDKPPISEDGEYQKFLKELQSYGCGYWKWLRKRRIREVFVVGSVTNPETGKIDKSRIKRKTADFMELADSGRFDIKTGRLSSLLRIGWCGMHGSHSHCGRESSVLFRRCRSKPYGPTRTCSTPTGVSACSITASLVPQIPLPSVRRQAWLRAGSSPRKPYLVTCREASRNSELW